MKVRRMMVKDLSEVAELEQQCFSRPWSEEALYRDYSQNPGSVFYVCELDRRVVGHVGLWKRDDEVHITTLAVDPAYQREGIGSLLIETVVDEFPDRDVTLEVRKSNDAAQTFYRDAGFNVTGRRPEYYSDNGEDALVMSLSQENRKREAVTDGRQ